MNRMKTYVLMVSTTFMKSHPRSGQLTNFLRLIFDKEKIHTIRGNYLRWLKISEQINKGNAVLSIRVWQGKPYRSKQEEIMQLTKIGVQRLSFILGAAVVDGDRQVDISKLSVNDGLGKDGLKQWFKDVRSMPLAIIHFTDFRY